MANDYLPARDANLANWTANFHALTTASPTTYGLTSAQATGYATNDSIWQAALATATDPSTRTKPSVAAKDAAKANIILLSRQLANVVQSFPTITDTLLSNLGLTVRSTSRPPTPPPATYPLIAAISAQGGQLALRINDQNTPDLRARPFGATACEIWIYTGTTPPTSLAMYSFLGLATRMPAILAYDTSLATKPAYIIGRWTTRRGQVGPWSSVATIVLG
jgi:hypothetical protein